MRDELTEKVKVQFISWRRDRLFWGCPMADRVGISQTDRGEELKRMEESLEKCWH